VSTDESGFRTYTWLSEWNGVFASCADIAMQGLSGTLEGDERDPVEPVWLRMPSGARVSVIWPAGFAVRFEPRARLYDATGAIVGTAGSGIYLDNVAKSSATGSYDDPYVASGRVFGHCYIFRDG
jgi:hypothetical protein